MINLKSLGVAVLLSAAIASPVLAQQAVQEPGMEAFYHPNGVSAVGAAPNAMASVREPARAAPRQVARASTHGVARAQTAATQ